MKHIVKDDPELAELIANEGLRMELSINLIAAENHAPLSIMEACGSILNTKAIEGYPGNRFHGGHLSHGHQASMTSKCFSFSHYIHPGQRD